MNASVLAASTIPAAVGLLLCGEFALFQEKEYKNEPEHFLINFTSIPENVVLNSQFLLQKFEYFSMENVCFKNAPY